MVLVSMRDEKTHLFDAKGLRLDDTVCGARYHDRVVRVSPTHHSKASL
jgi:hypothetical protein